MFNVLFALGTFIGVFVFLLLSIFIGRKYGRWQLERDHQTKVEVVTVAEGTVFALLGLLVAFTFTGAYERFEARKLHIINEANAVDASYRYIELLAVNTQEPLKQSLREYLDHRLEVYTKLPDLNAVLIEINKSRQLQKQIWRQALAATKVTNSEATTMLLMPTLNNMFEVAATRMDFTKIHPPVVVFILLIGLAIVGSLLAGYSMAGHKSWSLIHILSFAAITAFTIYLIIDLELPRIGLIRVDSFDQVLADVKKDLT